MGGSEPGLHYAERRLIADQSKHYVRALLTSLRADVTVYTDAVR